MASPRRSPWETAALFVEKLVFDEVPKFVDQVIEHGIGIGLDLLSSGGGRPSAITTGRPVTNFSLPTASRARRLVYAADLDGRADPGEIVWTWMVFGDDPDGGADRPVLVVGRDRDTLLGLLLTTRPPADDHRNWVSIGSGTWDEDGLASWVRVDRVLDVPEEGIRRQGAILDRPVFDAVATRLRVDYSWS